MFCMHRRLRSRGGAVLDGIDAHAAALRKAPGQVLAGSGAGEVAEVTVQVGLVVVAAFVGDLRETRRLDVQQELRDAVESHDPADRLRRQSDLLPEAGDQPSMA